jgi:hypothetical protein
VLALRRGKLVHTSDAIIAIAAKDGLGVNQARVQLKQNASELSEALTAIELN